MVAKGISQVEGEVIIFDKESEWAKAAKEILQLRNIKSTVESKDFQRCYTIARKIRCDVIIVNVHSLDDAIVELKQFKKDFPAITIILTQDRHDPEIREFFQNTLIGDYLHGEKKYIEIGRLSKLVEGIIQEPSSKINIHLPEDIDEVLASSGSGRTAIQRIQKEVSLRAKKHELKTVIRKLFLDSQHPDDQPIANEIYVERFDTSGKSTSWLFKIRPKVVVSEKDTVKFGVLKFGPKEETRRESKNYDKFVEWFLDYDQTVRKIGYEEGNVFGGILYSFLPKSITFAEFIRQKDTDKSLKIIDRMFNIRNQHWLSVDGNRHVNVEDTIIQSYYIHNVLHAQPYEIEEYFKSLCDEIRNLEKKEEKLDLLRYGEKQKRLTFPMLNMSIPHPISYLQRPIIKKLKFTIIHGDLHAHNILIAKNGSKYQFIDFYYTDYGDIYRDFIELELSVRYDLFSSRDLPTEARLTAPDCDSTNTIGLNKLIRLEQALVKTTTTGQKLLDPLVINDSTLNKAYRLISEIRQLAFANYSEKIDMYYLGLAFSSLKALKYWYPLDVKMYRLIIAGLYLEILEKANFFK